MEKLFGKKLILMSSSTVLQSDSISSASTLRRPLPHACINTANDFSTSFSSNNTQGGASRKKWCSWWQYQIWYNSCRTLITHFLHIRLHISTMPSYYPYSIRCSVSVLPQCFLLCHIRILMHLVPAMVITVLFIYPYSFHIRSTIPLLMLFNTAGSYEETS